MTRDVTNVTYQKRRLIFEKSSKLRLRLGRGQTNSCAPGAARDGGGAEGKVSIERWYIFPYIEKPLNSKVIKSFVPELRSRKFFSCFGILMLYIYVRYGHYERFGYRYEYVYFTYSYLGRIVELDSNVTHTRR